jgi:hypothetical protein
MPTMRPLPPLRCRLAALALFATALAACGDRGPGSGGDASFDAVLVAEPGSVTLGAVVRLDGGGSHDLAGVEARFSDSAFDEFRFEFGDGLSHSSDVHYVDHIYTAIGEYSVTLSVVSGDEEASATIVVTVRAPPPVIVAVDVSGDEVAVIGEWIALHGRGFREDNVPDVSFGGVLAANVTFASEYEILVQVPPTTVSGWNDLDVDFPQDDEGDDVFAVWVARFALATDAWRGAVYVVEFGQGDQYWPRSQSLEVDNAAVVRISADGAFALVGDARYQATRAPR